MTKAFLLGLPLVLLVSACGYDNDDHFHGNSSGVDNSGCSSSTTPAQSAIDVGAQLQVDAGEGAGVFIQYASGGHWQVQTACDTDISHTNCAWDVLVTPQDGSSIVNVVPSDLEAGDSVQRYPQDQVSYQLLATTTSDLDGFTFDSDPGSAVQVDAYLDGSCALTFFYWVGDGALHQGSPTNPITLIPSAN